MPKKSPKKKTKPRKPKISIALSSAVAVAMSMVLIYPTSNEISAENGTTSLKNDTSTILGLSDYPLSDGVSPPYHTAKSVIVQDLDSKVIMYSLEPDKPMMPASTTKIMTALVALDYYKDLSQQITITSEHLAKGHRAGLYQGEVITVENLLYAALIESGNDAAFALANNYPGGYDGFISAMNNKAKELSLKNTSFLNPSGVEQVGHYTTVRDLAILASYAYSNPVFNRIMSTQSITISSVDNVYRHNLTNTNELLGTLDGVIGVKTGWTENAGECLVTITKREGRAVVVVVLGSYDRFLDSTNLINWAFDHHNWLKPEI